MHLHGGSNPILLLSMDGLVPPHSLLLNEHPTLKCGVLVPSLDGTHVERVSMLSADMVH